MKGDKGVDVQVKDSITFRLGQSAPSQHPHMWYGGLGEFSASTEEKKNKISKVKSVTNSNNSGENEFELNIIRTSVTAIPHKSRWWRSFD